MTARMGVSVGRLPQEVLLEEFYRSECSELSVGRLPQEVLLEKFYRSVPSGVLEDCHKSSCWKNSIGVSFPRPCGSDVYVCSKSC
jgi:hypothetical protein